MLLKLIRNALGQIIILINFLTRPKKLHRSIEQQETVNQVTKKMVLYQFNACPFCVITRRSIRRLNLEIELRDTINVPQNRSDLSEYGGKIQVPCLRIENNGNTEWLYESKNIIQYLDNQFGASSLIENSER